MLLAPCLLPWHLHPALSCWACLHACRWHKPRYWEQRYFTCDEFYQPGGPIFFYLGNEADVTLYLNNTGRLDCGGHGAEAVLLLLHASLQLQHHCR